MNNRKSIWLALIVVNIVNLMIIAISVTSNNNETETELVMEEPEFSVLQESRAEMFEMRSHDPLPPTTTTTSTTVYIPPTTTTLPIVAEPEPEPVTVAPAAVTNEDTWERLAECETGTVPANWHINTGNGYYGGLQFSLSSWQAVGGTGYPHEASRATQIEMGERLKAQGGWGHWPACSSKLGYR